MKCNFCCCTYNKDSICVPEEVIISSLDICEDYVITELEEDLPDNEKERQCRENNLFNLPQVFP